ncbi:MAG: transposase [Smithella sp.]
MSDYNPNIHHRRSIRLKDYDYSQSGAYFVTICTHNKAYLFGHVEDGTMNLNNAGKMIERWHQELGKKFSNIKCIEHIVMPNHIHYIIQNACISVGADLRVCPEKLGECMQKGEHTGSPLQKTVQWFKTMSTNEYIQNVKNNQWPPFNGKLWQRNYYERIIRNEDELNRIREYIINNPINWSMDEYNSG